MKKIAKEQDIDTLSKFVKIAYNEDMNVSIFAVAIAQRSAASDWKLEKTYFLFGIRKGINNYIAAGSNGKIITGTEIIKTTTDNDAIQNLLEKMQRKARETIGGI